MKRFVPSIVLVLVLVATAPFVGQLRNYLFDTFAGRAVMVLSAGFTLVGVVALGVAIYRIRERRWIRYGGLVVVLALVWLQSVGFATDLATVNVVEKMHLLAFGLLALLLYRAWHAMWDEHPLDLLILPMFWVTVAGTLDEGMQWMVETRTGEVRDIWLNVVSGAIGLLFAVCLDPPKGLRWRLLDGRLICRSAALAIFALGLFVYDAHLGYMIDDPEIGRFRSWHSPEELRQAAEERTQRWATDPPGDLSPWVLEDRFLSEAGWHTHHRNSSFEHELYPLAHKANRILEKYYVPYLDLEHFRQTGDRRFPPHAVAKLEATPPVKPENYVSPVLEGRVFVWPSKRLFLAVWLPLVTGLWLLGQRFGVSQSPRSG